MSKLSEICRVSLGFEGPWKHFSKRWPFCVDFIIIFAEPESIMEKIWHCLHNLFIVVEIVLNVFF